MPLPLILGAVGLAAGAIGAIGKGAARRKGNKEMNALLKNDPTYAANPMAQQRLGLAQTLLNARQPGSAAAERNIYGAQANQMHNASRNATDASQLLALGAVGQGNTNEAFGDLQQAEAQDYQRRYSNLEQAQEGAIRESDKVYEDGLRKFQNKVQVQSGIAQNRQNGWGDIMNLGFGMAQLGMSAGGDGTTVGSLFGGMKQDKIFNSMPQRGRVTSVNG